MTEYRIGLPANAASNPYVDIEFDLGSRITLIGPLYAQLYKHTTVCTSVICCNNNLPRLHERKNRDIFADCDPDRDKSNPASELDYDPDFPIEHLSRFNCSM